MKCIKAFLTGLVTATLSMANISGIVTDTGTTPIAGVLVRLEKGGQSATTGTDGRFTIATTSILTGNGKSFQNNPTAIVSGNILNVTVAERSAVEVAAFNLSGKMLATIRQYLDQGIHSIALPYRGAGIYLYKVKTENNLFVLKSNSVGGGSSGSSKTTKHSSSNPLAKLAKTTAAMNDVIAATKTGYLNYRIVAYNSDTTGMEIKMIASAGTVTDADGNVYQTVRIGNQVWLAENLRVTKYNDGFAIPFDTSMATWNSAITPKYCFYNNTTNSDSIKQYGALYNWYVGSSTNSKKIALTGWHVPSDAEWDTLKNYLLIKGNNWDATITGNKIAKSLAAKMDWYTYSTTGTIGCNLTINNSSGFSAFPGGARNNNGGFGYQAYASNWWCATEGNATTGWYRYLYYDADGLTRSANFKSCGYSVRLLRNN